jgi:hypothetical protein
LGAGDRRLAPRTPGEPGGLLLAMPGRSSGPRGTSTAAAPTRIATPLANSD